MPTQIAPNFPEKKLYFIAKINVCIFAYVKIILYICSTKEGETLPSVINLNLCSYVCKQFHKT